MRPCYFWQRMFSGTSVEMSPLEIAKKLLFFLDSWMTVFIPNEGFRVIILLRVFAMKLFLFAEIWINLTIFAGKLQAVLEGDHERLGGFHRRDFAKNYQSTPNSGNDFFSRRTFEKHSSIPLVQNTRAEIHQALLSQFSLLG